MGFIVGYKCKHCNTIFYRLSGVDGLNEQKKNTLESTFLCRSCNKLSNVDINYEKLECKNCNSKNITEEFTNKEIKCLKCGKSDFERIEFSQT